ncbi:hypothetical protein CKO25_04580 [Thiocapsa imhoffii]|uniref:DUF2272 domain-containing protein n=2 Tax=Thiocapsa imhoffii TaxID=382777 RepID=A0A9X0WGM8_9GAMM|nr:hypothetical protein [Thiocapsa imhoffii]
MVVSALLLTACGSTPGDQADTPQGTWAGQPIGPPPARNAGLKRAMIRRAIQEWESFEQQVVVLQGRQESIPNVGAWEDDASHAGRVNRYWRAVGRPSLDGMDCQHPWSAAFLSWIMRDLGVSEDQFRPASAHWIYLTQIIERASDSGRYFVPRRIQDYTPEPGDLICAGRGRSPLQPVGGDTRAAQLQGAPTHCDLVVGKRDQQLEVIGGNVRNSVSKSILELDDRGRLQPVPRRPWFLIIENRL